MKRTIIAAAALVLLSTAASAFEISCAAPRVALGDDPADNNPVVKVEVKYSNSEHAWRIFHHRRDGLVVSRGEQYAIQDASNERKTQWQGSLNRARHLYMVGEVKRTDDGSGIVYLEWLYDRKKGDQLVMHAQARCVKAAPPIPEPTASLQPIPATPLPDRTPLQPKPVQTTPVVNAKDSVPIYPHAQGNAAKIDVLIGGQPLRMLLDTGATTCLISEAIAARLVADGHAVWQENSRFKMADGTVRNMPMVLIREMRLGRHTIRNVPAGVSGTDGIILAFPVVNGIAPFTIDTRAGELVFHHS